MAKSTSKGNSIAPRRFILFFAILIGGGGASMAFMEWSKGLLLGFDAAAILFLLTCIPGFSYDAAKMREVAEQNDANRGVLLILSFLLTAVIFAAVVVELGQRAQLSQADKLIIAATLALVWLFANAVYTLHYAHLFYTSDDKGKDCAGLEFPGTKEPIFADFVYFAYTLGVAVQTSDVQITSRHIRNVATAHCVAGFFFNLGVLALTINILGSS